MKSFLWRHKSLFAIWAIVFGIAGYAGYLLFLKPSGTENPYVLSNKTDKSSAGQEKPANPQNAGPTKVELGQTATNGDFEFNVIGIKCGDTTMGANEYAHDEATGVFCRLSLSLKNIGTSASSLPGAKQRIIDATGKEYFLDDEATQYAQADPGQSLWFDQVEPGKTVSGDLVFDVTNEDITKAVLQAGETPEIEVAL